jgi:SSS family solute:Na+ symporter
MVAGALLLASLLPVDLNGALLAVSAVFVLYTLWGGQLSVVRTDSWQLFLFVGSLVITVALVVAAGGGVGRLLGRVPAGHLAFPTGPAFGWYQVLVFYPLIVGVPYLVGPDMYSRVLCARSEEAARKGALAAGLLVIPLSFLLAVLGLLIAGLLPGLSPEAALPEALSRFAPPGLRGMIVVGVLGAIMSSADTTLVSASTILSLNVVTPLTGLGREAQLRLTRVGVVVLGVLAWSVATFQEGIIDSLLLAYTVFVGGVALPTLASFWSNRLGVTASGAFWAVVLGGGTALLGGIRDGALLRALVGEGAESFLQRILGPEFPSLLPLLVSGAALLGISRLRR